MGILYVIGSLDYGGAELLVVELARWVAARGGRVEVLVLGDCQSEILDSLREKGVSVDYRPGGYGFFAGLRRLGQAAKTPRIDVVHAHLFPALYLCALARSVLTSGARWIYTEHSTSNRRRNVPLCWLLERFVYGRYDEVTCVSSAVAESLRSWLNKPLPLRVIYNGIERQHYESASPASRSSYRIPEDAILVLAVGRLRSEKNHAGLIEAMHDLPHEYHLLIAGEGPERDKLENLVGALDLESRVTLPGNISDVAPLLKMADVFALVSLFEGFGLSALEAVAADIPLVHSDSPELREVFSSYGVAAEPGNSDSISNAIKLAAKRDRPGPERNIVRERILADFSLDQTVAAYLNLYHE